MRKCLAGLLVSAALFIGNCGLQAAEVVSTVTYVASNSVYIGAGSASGIQTGDRVSIYHGESLVALMEIIFVSESSSSCRLLESSGVIQKGDRAVVVIETGNSDRIPAEPNSTPGYEPTPKPNRESRIESNRLSGRISAGVESQSSGSDFNYRFSEPYVRVRAALSRINGSPFEVRVNLRTRRVIREADNPRVESEWNNRVYELALVYDNPQDPLQFRAGRMIVNELRGIGYLDGALAGYRITPQITSGLFAGSDPDLENTKIQPDRLKSGIFATFEKKNVQSRMSGTLALAGSYVDGEINREFVYEQFYVSPVRQFNLQQSLELNINRDWLKDAESSSTTLSSLFFSMNYTPVHVLALSAAYDTRKNYHSWESRTVPDSLFDDAQRQGFRGSLTLRPAKTIRWLVGVSVRSSAGRESDSHTGNTTLAVSNIGNMGILAAASLRSYATTYSEGLQTSLRVSKSIVDPVHVSLETGNNRYDLVTESGTIDYQWYRASVDINWSRSVYSGTAVEIYDGREVSSSGFSLELGYRL